MRWSALWWFAVIAAMVMLEANAAPSPRNDNMLQELLKLDQLYSSVARPSVRSGPTQPDSMGPKVQRAINMLRLQHLDRLYGDPSRPRFGKRVETNSNFAPIEYEVSE
ncbi:uncharacterized protein LOC135127127 isoform X2 [Zophobas morio]|uniref:uncharacterized protein LOC135127127 isoform X2 n=1 Tax=Zophobas morio TaxID=2755281 RepID=UPI003083528E